MQESSQVIPAQSGIQSFQASPHPGAAPDHSSGFAGVTEFTGCLRVSSMGKKVWTEDPLTTPKPGHFSTEKEIDESKCHIDFWKPVHPFTQICRHKQYRIREPIAIIPKTEPQVCRKAADG